MTAGLSEREAPFFTAIGEHRNLKQDDKGDIPVFVILSQQSESKDLRISSVRAVRSVGFDSA